MLSEPHSLIADRSLRLSYQYAGEQLGSHLEGLVPSGMEEGEWLEAVEKLALTIRSKRYEEAIDWIEAWLEARFPQCLALIPLRKRRVFAHGVYETLNPQ